MAVPKHKRLRSPAPAANPTPLLGARACPCLTPRAPLLALAPKLSLRRRPHHPLLRGVVPLLGVGRVAHPGGSASPLCDLATFFLFNSFAANYSPVGASRWLWFSYPFAKSCGWFAWPAPSFFVHTTHPIALRFPYFRRCVVAAVRAAYQTSGRSFFFDVGYLPIPNKHLWYLFLFLHAPLL